MMRAVAQEFRPPQEERAVMSQIVGTGQPQAPAPVIGSESGCDAKDWRLWGLGAIALLALLCRRRHSGG